MSGFHLTKLTKANSKEMEVLPSRQGEEETMDMLYSSLNSETWLQKGKAKTWKYSHLGKVVKKPCIDRAPSK